MVTITIETVKACLAFNTSVKQKFINLKYAYNSCKQGVNVCEV